MHPKETASLVLIFLLNFSEFKNHFETFFCFSRIVLYGYTIKIDGKKYATAYGRQCLCEFLEQIECEMGAHLIIEIDIVRVDEAIKN